MMLRLLLTLAVMGMTEPVLADNGFQVTPGGAHYKDVAIGGGPVAIEGDTATIHFRGWLARDYGQGKELVNSRAERQPITFVVGTDRVMPGWNEGVIGMREGGRRLVKLLPELGFGARGSAGVIPPNAGLVFMIELVSLEKAGE